MKYIVVFLLLMGMPDLSGQYDSASILNKSDVSRPNILWIVTEDISPTLSFYGDSTAKTPRLDALAEESMIYDNAFTTVGVCAPSRSSIITGMYPTSIGTQHMRTGKDVFSWGKRVYNKHIGRKDIEGKPIIEYSAVIPSYVKCYTEYLRNAGYYCTNNSKTDYQFAAPLTAWDENDSKAHWRNRPDGKPFFSVFNIGITHESQLWKNERLPLTVSPEEVQVPPYLPDISPVRRTIARHYSNIELMDKRVGKIIDQLKSDGLYDKTIIFFYSDHGGPLPRQKREIYDSGLRVPFMIKGIAGTRQGRTKRLISFVDLAPTMLSIVGMKAPEYMQGKAFMGRYEKAPREFVFGSSDRFDEATDRIRSVRSKQFLYLRNFYPELPKYKEIRYRNNIPMMPPFLELQRQGKLNENQQAWFETKTDEELYDCVKDPHNLNNLAKDERYADVLRDMRAALHAHLFTYPDLGQVPESKLIAVMWPNNTQPQTQPVTITRSANEVTLSSPTPGASISYLVSEEPLSKVDYNSGWQLYNGQIKILEGQYLYALATRIGYKDSEVFKRQF